jgi:hypothetical protein
MNGIHSTNHKFKALWILAKKLRDLMKLMLMFYQAKAQSSHRKNVSWNFFDTHTPQL